MRKVQEVTGHAQALSILTALYVDSAGGRETSLAFGGKFGMKEAVNTTQPHSAPCESHL